MVLDRHIISEVSMKISIIGDMHLKSSPPSIRKDDFLTNVLNKLEYVLRNYKRVIVLGDMFHEYDGGGKKSIYLFNRVYRILNKYPGRLVSILGNHDIFGRDHTLGDKTIIESLEAVGALEIKTKPFIIDGVTFAVSLVDKSNFKDIPIDEKNENVLLGHNYYNMELCPEESLSKEEIKKLGYKYVILGHDHKNYEEDYTAGDNGNDHIIIRMGSFTRIDRQPYNENREINYYEYDTETREVEKKIVPSLPDSDVFIENAFEKKIGRSEINFVKIGEVLQRFRKSSEGEISLLKTLERINTPPRHIQMIKYLHSTSNVVFN